KTVPSGENAIGTHSPEFPPECAWTDARDRPFAASHRLTFPSSVLVASRLPSCESTPRPVAPGHAALLWPDLRSRNSVPWAVARKKHWPAGSGSTDCRSFHFGPAGHDLNPFARLVVVISRLAAVLHSLTEPSFPPEASMVPSAETATLTTESRWAPINWPWL